VLPSYRKWLEAHWEPGIVGPWLGNRQAVGLVFGRISEWELQVVGRVGFW
jgi:hypothetical protein